MIASFLIALSLSMDSLAASVASGPFITEHKLRNALRIAFAFALFQGGMPIIGWVLGDQMESLIVDYDHWVAFILLTLISGKVVWDTYFGDGDEPKMNPLRKRVLLTLSIATSIDALVVGVTFGVLKNEILWPALIITLVTFVVSLAGVWFSSWLRKKLDAKLELFGAFILFAIGVKILIEHTMFP